MEKFGRLTVIETFVKNKKRRYAKCLCECGNETVVRYDGLKSRTTKSCGCLKKEQDKNNLGHKIDGRSKTRLYTEYHGIKNRCYNEYEKCYPRYGDRVMNMKNVILDMVTEII